MDPAACLARIIEALAAADHAEAKHACDDLIGWFERGGCWPETITTGATLHAAVKELRRLLAMRAAIPELRRILST